MRRAAESWRSCADENPESAESMTIRNARFAIIGIQSLNQMLRRSKLSLIGLILITIFALCAIFAPLLAPASPVNIDLPHRLLAPTAHHLFGTDDLCSYILSTS